MVGSQQRLVWCAPAVGPHGGGQVSSMASWPEEVQVICGDEIGHLLLQQACIRTAQVSTWLVAQAHKRKQSSSMCQA